MKPDVTLVLRDHSTRLAEKIVPKLAGFDANGVAMISAMLIMVAEEFDRAAARRVEENAAIREIFRWGAEMVADPLLAEELVRLASGMDEALHIPALDAANEGLRSALIRLHEHVETLEGAEARSLDEAIWAELRHSVERRAISLANF